MPDDDVLKVLVEHKNSLAAYLELISPLTVAIESHPMLAGLKKGVITRGKLCVCPAYASLLNSAKTQNEFAALADSLEVLILREYTFAPTPFGKLSTAASPAPPRSAES